MQPTGARELFTNEPETRQRTVTQVDESNLMPQPQPMQGVSLEGRGIDAGVGARRLVER